MEISNGYKYEIIPGFIKNLYYNLLNILKIHLKYGLLLDQKLAKLFLLMNFDKVKKFYLSIA